MSIIVNDLVESYINELYNSRNDFLRKLRDDAEEEGVPIITKDTEGFMSVLLTIHKPKKILEIGTAIGYSGIFFASLIPKTQVVSIEMDDNMYLRARENIKKSGMTDHITDLKGDARNIIADLDETFDMIFIDAAKGHYTSFFKESLRLLKPEGVIVSDNVLYRGMTASNAFLIKRKRTIVKRMREYLAYISNHPEFETAVLSIGDGIAVSARKVEE